MATTNIANQETADSVASSYAGGATTLPEEMYFQYAKIQPYLREFRQQMNLPEWMMNLERLVESSKDGRKRLAVMRKNLAAMAELRATRTSAAAEVAKSVKK